MRLFWKKYLKLNGWNTEVSFPYHHLNKYIIIVGPHTSNWDFIIGLAYRSYLGLTKTRFLAKKELFVAPFGELFKNLGGIPVDRKRSSHLVEDVVKLFRQHEKFSLALSPEGTRSKVEKLRTGFYFIAVQASVPIIMVGLDWKNKTLLVGEPLFTRENGKDFETIRSFYRGIEGRYPALGMMDQ